MAKATESELKFTFDDAALSTVKDVISRAIDRQPERRRLLSRYYDTERDDLWRKGTTLRVREDGSRRIQTVKQEGPSVLSRDEIETPADGDGPDLGALERTSVADLFRKARIRRHLQPNLDIDVTREASAVDADGACIEAAVDVGEVRAKGAVGTLNELELELKSGPRQKLFELARRLSAEAPISLSVISKAERGHLLSEGAWGRAYKGRGLRIKPGMTCAEAFQLCCRTYLHDFVINVQALRGDERTEAVHQGRVALRRLRAALQLFKSATDDDDRQHLDDELRWISHVFGEARDLDVFQESVFEPAARIGAPPGARELAQRTRARTEEAHQAIESAIASSRLRFLMIDLVAWIECGRWRAPDRTEWRRPIEDYAPRALKKRFRKFVKRAVNLVKLDETARHKIRIQAKKLRYMAAFFKDAPGVVGSKKRLDRLLKRLKLIQDCLGRLHDDHARADFLIKEIASVPNNADAMIGFAAGQLARPVSDSSKLLASAEEARRKLIWSRAF